MEDGIEANRWCRKSTKDTEVKSRDMRRLGTVLREDVLEEMPSELNLVLETANI